MPKRKAVDKANALKAIGQCVVIRTVELEYLGGPSLVDRIARLFEVDAKGLVTNFAMNDKCAAGSSRFLKVMAHALRVKLKDGETFTAI